MLHLIPDVSEPEQQDSPHPILTRRRVKIAAIAVAIPLSLLMLVGIILYFRYAHMIDARLSDGPFSDSVNIYAAPLVISPGDAVTESGLAAELETAGFSTKASGRSNAGSYQKLFPTASRYGRRILSGAAVAVWLRK